MISAAEFLKWCNVFNITPGGGGGGGAPANASYITLTDFTGVLPQSIPLSQIAGAFLVNKPGTGELISVQFANVDGNITIDNADGQLGGTVNIDMAPNPIFAGTAGMGVPEGTTAERVVPTSGQNFRYNTETLGYEYYNGTTWVVIGGGGAFLEIANNLSDVADVAASRANLGLDTMALQASNAVDITGGTITPTTLNYNFVYALISGDADIAVSQNNVLFEMTQPAIALLDGQGLSFFPDGFQFIIKNTSIGDVSFIPFPGDTIDGLSSLILAPKEAALIAKLPSEWATCALFQNLTVPIPVNQGGTGLTGVTALSLLFASATDTIGEIPTAVNAALSTDGSGNPSFSTILPDAVMLAIDRLNTQIQDFDMGTHQIHNLVDPTSAQDAATMNFVMSIAAGLSPVPGVYGASTANLTGWVYNNGASGIGATLTAPGNGVFTEDGIAVPVGQRWLYKDDTDAGGVNNGIYTVTISSAGAPAVLTRSTNYDTPSEIHIGDLISVEFGALNARSSWYQTSAVSTIGTNPITFSVFFNPASYISSSLANGKIFIGNGSGIATTSAATYPSSTTVNQLMWSSATNVISGLATVNSAGLLTSAGGVPGWVAYTGTGAPVLATSPTLITPTIGAAIATSIRFGAGLGGLLDNNGNIVLDVATVASANQGFLIEGDTSFTSPIKPPYFGSFGTGTDIPMMFGTKGAGHIFLASNNGGTGGRDIMAEFIPVAVTTGFNYLSFGNAVTAGNPYIEATGLDSAVNMNIRTKGAASILFSGESGSSPILNLQTIASSVNYININGNITGSFPTIGAAGADTNINLSLTSKGTGSIFLYSNQNTNAIASFVPVASSVNFLTFINSATNNPVSINATGTDGNILLQLSGKGNLGAGVQGCSTNNNAATGNNGEYVSSSVLVGSAVSLVSATAKTITSILLTAGDYDVSGMIVTSPNAATTSTSVAMGISQTNNTFPTPAAECNYAAVNGTFGAGVIQSINNGRMRISLATTTTIYLVAQVTFLVNTMAAYGFIGARRVR